MTETYKLGWTWNPFTKQFEKIIHNDLGSYIILLANPNPFVGV